MNERSIFAAALDIDDPDQRAAYLDEACGDNPQRRRHFDDLLAAEGKLGSFLARPPVVPDQTGKYEPMTERPGTVIGPYKLMEQIGEGGMGLVFVAEQQEPVRRKVALKVIKPGMDTRDVVARFEAERQALALMDHPNIAKVFDGGATESGRPYFVMELVKGVPLTDYCDQNQLTLRERLDLFVAVCRAVQHAHTKGIIHRDLKPTNVLVTLHDNTPVVKVIDFGVAKAIGQHLTDKTIYTAFAQMIGTPLYMSPEQAQMSGLDIDTRSDIYSLGVLLYELLTGTTPFDSDRLKTAAFDEIRRIIREEEPPRPSTRLTTLGATLSAVSAKRKTEPGKLSALMRGEVDWIVMKALEKDRSRRYETATGLARDVEHYLRDEPVEACPPTVGYRLRKFARKHLRLLTTTAAFAVVLLLGAAGSVWQAVRATQAEAVALANERQANANEKQAKEKEHEANKQRDEVQALNKKLQETLKELRATQEQLRSTLYAAHMNLAKNAWEAVDSGRVRELLEHHRPKPEQSDLRGFEWYYLDRFSHAELLTLKGHSFGVMSVAFSPDGKCLASVSPDKTVKVWDAQTGQELLSLRKHTRGVYAVAFSPDGKRLASGSNDKTVKVWDAQSGRELLTLTGHTAEVTGVAFSPDGKRLASSGTAGELKVWDTHTGQELHSPQGHKGIVSSVAFSPDGKRLASSSGTWDDTKKAFVAGEVKVLDALTGQELITVKQVSYVNRIAFSPDGKRLVSTCDKTLKVWDAQTGKELLSLYSGGSSVAFSPDGKRLAGASLDNTVKVWDAQTGTALLTFKGHTGSVNSVAFNPDGSRIVSAGDRTVRVWDAQTSQNHLTLKGEATSGAASVAFSPDGERLASASKVWNARTGQELLHLKGGRGSVAFSPDGKLLALGSAVRVKVWDAQTGQQLLTLNGHSIPVLSVAFSPDGKRLAGAGKVWDAQTGQEILSFKGAGRNLVFSPDGKRLAGDSKGNKAIVWDAQTGKELVTLQGGSGSLAFSPDGKRLAGASLDNTLKVWDAQTGQELLTLKGHNSSITAVAFSPDGKRLVTAAPDRFIKLWDVQAGQELFTFEGDGGVVSGVAFSPDGHRLAAGAADGTVKIWDATPLPQKR